MPFLPGGPSPLGGGPTPQPAPLQNPAPPGRDFLDHHAVRNAIYGNVLKAAQGVKPVENQRYSLSLHDVGWADPDHFSLKDQKRALLEGRTLARRLRGTWRLTDKGTQKVVDERAGTIAHVPHYTPRHTFILNGTDYQLASQMRLLPGVYSRQKENGEIEAHCFHRTVKVWTEDGMVPIGDIVRKKLKVRVWSYDFEAERFVLKPVVGWYRNKVKDGMGRAVFDAPGRLPVRFDRHHPNVLWATPSHKVFTPDGAKHELCTVAELTMVEDKPSASQEQLVYGSLLGDGYIAENGLWQEAHGTEQEAYIRLKAKILAPFLNSDVSLRDNSGYGKQSWWLQSKAWSFLYRMRAAWYRDGLKRVSQECLDRVDERGLAFWFCDDGSAARAKNQHGQSNHLLVTLATDGFLTEDVDLLLGWLSGRWGVQGRRARNEKAYGGRDIGWQLIIGGEDAERFLDLVAPYVPPSMHYKLGPRPITGRCKGCTKEIDRRQNTCNACCLASHVTDMARSTARHRFGGAAEVRRMLAAGEVPPDINLGERWDVRMAAAGGKVAEMVADSTPTLGLTVVPCQYRFGEGLHFEKATVAFDIEVADTHNYVANGVLVSNCNVIPGKGLGHRYSMDPDTGVFKAHVGGSSVPLLSLLRAMGATDTEIRQAWGDALLAQNAPHDDPKALEKLYAKLVRKGDPSLDSQGKVRAAVEAYQKMEVDPEVTKATLGHPHPSLSKEAVLAATRKLLQVSRGEAEPDDRDHLAYQRFLGPEDLLPERIQREKSLLNQALWKATLKGNLQHMVPGAYTGAVQGAILDSGLGLPAEEINVLELLNGATKVSKMGVGGVASIDAVPDESRSVQPSHLGYIDSLITPESFRAGVDSRIAYRTRKGPDGRVYTPYRDARSGREVFLSAQDLAGKTVAFPGELEGDSPVVRAVRGGKVDMVPRQQVDYALPHMEHAFAPLSNLVPLKSMSKGQRVSMGSRFLTQAVPLEGAEAPLVSGKDPSTGRSFGDVYGAHAGAVRAREGVGGRVLKVTPDEVQVRYDDGRTETHELYNWQPLNRKTLIHNTPLVQQGDRVDSGQLLARSNYTDDRGHVALGLNLRTAYIPISAPGTANFEDAFVISESAARRLKSEHAYQHQHEWADGHKKGKKAFASIFPSAYDRKTLETLDDDGVVKPGTVVKHGDPLVLVASERDLTHKQVHSPHKGSFSDQSVLWDHHDDGVVVDAAKTQKGVNVVVKSYSEMKEGDKVAGLWGDKGVCTVLPDEQMPHDEEGRPFEVLANPLGLISRVNNSQIAEAILGKVAQKTGQPYVLGDFDPANEDWTAWVRQEAQKHGVKDTEVVTDPTTGRKIPGVLTGVRHYLKLHHMSEHKSSARGLGSYDANDMPARGSAEGAGAKRVAMMDVAALLSHGALSVLKDSRLIRGARNADYWASFLSGNKPATPPVPLVYEKFVNSLKAAGINVVREGTGQRLMALTDRDVDQLAGDRELRNAGTVDWEGNMRPVPGGLFDDGIFGGHGGSSRWGKITLHEPLPSPAFEEPARRVLGLTQRRFEGVLSGKEQLGEHGTGPGAIQRALSSVNLEKALNQAREDFRHARGQRRDDAVRKLGYLKSCQQLGLHPRDWVLKAVPVLPPLFRPVSVMKGTGGHLIADSNMLYKELHDANSALKELHGKVDDLSGERLNLYRAFKAVVGLGDPVSPKSQEKGVRGILKQILGDSPKFNWAQRELLSGSVNTVGRAVVVPDPDLDMDSVGIPEGQAWGVYSPFVLRRLIRKGVQRDQALRYVEEKHPSARQALQEEADARPVLVTRAPVLHRYGVMAFRPKLVKGDVIRMNPYVHVGFNLDHDGDVSNWHVPVSDDSVREAFEKMLPSKNLFSAADFKKPMYGPGKEFASGLHTLSTAKSANRPARVFADMPALRRAWERGELHPGDPVEVMRPGG